MVQILNKMVHLKHTILQIFCCHNNITQMPPLRLKFGTMFRNMSPIDSAEQLCTSHCCRRNTQHIVPTNGLFDLTNQMHASKTQLLGQLWHLFLSSNAFSKAQIWHKAEEYVPKYFESIALCKLMLQGKKTVLLLDFVL